MGSSPYRWQVLSVAPGLSSCFKGLALQCVALYQPMRANRYLSHNFEPIARVLGCARSATHSSTWGGFIFRNDAWPRPQPQEETRRGRTVEVLLALCHKLRVRMQRIIKACELLNTLFQKARLFFQHSFHLHLPNSHT